jgi:hypothetical protein
MFFEFPYQVLYEVFIHPPSGKAHSPKLALKAFSEVDLQDPA